eukprot:121141_1
MSQLLLYYLLIVFLGTVYSAPTLGLTFSSDYNQYNITVNNEIWLQSANTSFRNNGKWTSLQLNSTSTINGHDNFGDFNDLILNYIDINNNSNEPQFATHFRTYPSNPTKIVFIQHFLQRIKSTADHIDGIISSFPSFIVTKPPTEELGYVHFGGHFTAFVEPQFGSWSSTDNQTELLSGGIMETGPMAIFNKQNSNCIVISALTDHMAINDNATLFDRHNQLKQMRWGIQGNVDTIPSDYEIYFILTIADGGVNSGMLEWGDRQLQWNSNNLKKRGDSHTRDYSLNYLGYSTDHGAFYYYYTEDNNTKNYQET